MEYWPTSQGVLGTYLRVPACTLSRLFKECRIPVLKKEQITRSTLHAVRLAYARRGKKKKKTSEQGRAVSGTASARPRSRKIASQERSPLKQNIYEVKYEGLFVSPKQPESRRRPKGEEDAAVDTRLHETSPRPDTPENKTRGREGPRNQQQERSSFLTHL